MDPKFLDYYNQELRHIRETCGEFAKAFPKIGGRLGLEGFECADPYVERLLEGFAYMAARVQLKVDAEFPRFSQHLLEMVYPDYLAPTPSMGIVRFQPDLAQTALAEGFALHRRQTVLRGLLTKGVQTSCDYLTAHDVTLWPIELVEVKYLRSTAAVAALGISNLAGAKAGMRFRLRTAGGLPFDKLPLDSLVLYLLGGDQVAMRTYEQLLANTVSVVLQSTKRDDSWRHVLAKSAVRRVGFDDNQALLPRGPQSFQGYRLLHEYFAFAERFMFVAFDGLRAGLRRCKDTEIDIVVLLDRSVSLLEEAIDASRFALFCSPVINLFPKRADRIALSDQSPEYHVLPDRSRPMDFEVYAITSVLGYGAGTEPEQEFLPFYRCNDRSDQRRHRAYYTVYRTPRLLSSRQRLQGPRSSYIGSEVFLSLVDANQAPYATSLRQLGIEALCTNRDLPLQMPVGAGKTDLTMDVGAPVETVRFLSGPSAPHPSTAHRDIAWKLISHLSLNYLSLTDGGQEQGAAALRDLLQLYAVGGDSTIEKQIEGVTSVASKPIYRRLPAPGPITVGRGLEVTVTLDEAAFEGTGAYLLGAVLEEFFARYVAINSFTETVVKTPSRGEIMRWPARIGRRHVF